MKITKHLEKIDLIKRLLKSRWSTQEIYSLLYLEGYTTTKSFIERLKNETEQKKCIEDILENDNLQRVAFDDRGDYYI